MELGIKLVPQHKRIDGGVVDVSVVIAHRGPEMGLWMTLESCKMDLDASGLSYEFVVVVNGEEKLSEDLLRQKYWLGKGGHLGEFVHVAEPMSPPSARHLGAESARGRFLFFFDNHCMVAPGYFRRAVESMDKHGMDVLHSTTRFWMGEQSWYEYGMDLTRNFWVRLNYEEPISTEEPYRVAVAGHGGFAVRADFWRKIDGYWQGFEGYAGEEPYFDFKAWLMGGTVWIDPKVVHYHWSGKRGYNRHYTDDYFRNLLMAAHIIGGEKWLYTVYDSFVVSTRLMPGNNQPVTPMIDILESAYKRSLTRTQWLTQRQVRTFDEQLEFFKQNGIRF
jgi:hypothetical protein